jgi:hypothetical protein
VSPEPSAANARIRALRAATYFVALLVASTAGLLAYVSAVLMYSVFGLVIAAVLVLLVDQPISRLTVASMVLVTVAFIAPATFVHITYSSAGCIDGVPCDPAPNLHEGLHLGLAAVLLFAALITAAVGAIRSSRLMNATHLRRHELA